MTQNIPESFAMEDEEPQHIASPIHTTLLMHARTYSLFVISPKTESLDATSTAIVVERFRPTLEVWWGDTLGIEAAWDVIPIIGAGGVQATGFAVQTANALRFEDFDNTLYAPTPATWTLNHNLDRLSIRVGSPELEIQLGRQAMGFGSARMLPAADLFAPFGPGTIDTEFKRGVDAARISATIGGFHEVELVAIAHQNDPAHWLYLSRWKGSFSGILDVGVLAGLTFERPTLAVDLSGDVFGAAWYAEASARISLDDDEPHSIRATTGLDYQWESGLRTLLEVHYNHQGQKPPCTDLIQKPSLERRLGEVNLLGAWYAGASVNYTFTPLLAGGFGYIQNLTDGSALLTTSMGYDFAENISVSLGGIVPIGANLQVNDVRPPTLKSEFGSYPFVGFMDIRLTF